MRKLLNCAASALASLTLLSSCASGPTVCPTPPAPPAAVPLGPSFLDEMRTFLSGSLPEQIPSERSSAPAKPASAP